MFSFVVLVCALVSLQLPAVESPATAAVAPAAAAVAPAAAAVAPTAAAAAPDPTLLVYYHFEEPHPSGPDTFRLFRRPAGAVDLSTSFRVSGERSLRLSEGRADGSFSEFLGFFPERTEGKVYVQFYLLFSDPSETFNFALAGWKWFLRYEQHGHALWIATQDGRLVHRPGGEWQELFAPEAFLWYFFDLVYDVDRGTYDLRIYEEGQEEPLVDLYRQRNVARADRSAIQYYSFIGDLEDRDRAMIYVDDILIATSPKVLLEPFVAPGRRRFFVERWAVGPAPENAQELEDLLWEGRDFLRRGGELEDGAADPLERAADQAFLTGDLELAEELYRRLGTMPDRAARILLKMSDVHFQRGDLRAERLARERIYGSLELEGRRPPRSVPEK